MSEELKRPHELANLSEVARYWRQCLSQRSTNSVDDTVIASHMVGVVSNANDERWSEGSSSHPAYSLIFELASSLELPANMTGQRDERWQCIEALLGVLERSENEDHK